jgi:hypothetical protein
MQLSRAERRFVVAARTGEALALGNDTPTKALATHRIRATVIRRLLLGDPLLPDDTESSARAPHVLDLTGAWIDGRLDLRDMRAADGGSGPTIRLKACVVPKGIALTSGHFSELSLLDCRFPELLADGALFDGLVDLSGSASTEVDAACTGCARPDDDGEPRPQGRCHISLTGAMINGDVKTSNARLCAPPRDPDFDVAGGGRPYALKLNGARVSGGLVMQPGLVALGGIDIGNAEIGGSVWLQGAHLTAEWSLAFNAQMARIRGGVALSALFRDDKPAHPFISEGCVNLYGALIEGELYMQGAKLRAGPDGVALSGFQARIEKMVRVSVALDEQARVSSVPFEAKGQVDFSNSVLGGFNAGGAVFDGGGKAALLLNGAQITGETRLESAQGLQVETSSGEVIVRRIIHRCLVRGMIQASKASLDQGVWIAGVRLEGGEGFGLDLLETRIGRSFHLRAFEGPDEPAPGVTRMVTLRTEIDGGLLRLDGSEIDGEFHIRGAVIGNGQQAILARAVKVGDRLVLSELNAKGTLIFNAAKIVNEVLIEDLVSSPPDQAATLDLDNSQIGGSFFLRRFEAPGPIRASFAQIGGEVLIAGRFTGPGLALTLESARISGNLNLDLATSAMVKLDYVTVGGLATVHQFAASSRLETSIQLSADGAHFDGGLELKPNCVSLDSFPRFGDVRGLRATDAVFYPGWQVVEAFVLTPAESGIFTLLWDGVRRSTPLNGLGDVITRFNASGAARLILTEDTVFAYAAFHLANGWADRGAVRLLSDTADLDAYGMKLRDPEAPFKSVTRLDDGVWRLEGPAEYNDRLFATVVEVRADGEVTITQNQLLTDQSVIKRRFARPLRKGAAGSDPLSMRILSELDPARPWPVRTQTTQTWEDLADHVDRTVRAIGALRSDTETSTGAPNGARLIAALSVRRVRLQALNCYPGWFLAQGLIDGPKGQGVIGWLWDGDSRGVLLNGKSDPIHRFNLDQPPHLETDEQVFTYVRLFCAYVWAEEGAFIVIDDAEELPFPEDEREDRAGAVRPMRVTGRGAKIKVEATICYGDTLFYSLFEIHPTGFVEMMQDEMVEVPPGQIRIAHDFPFITPASPHPQPALRRRPLALAGHASPGGRLDDPGQGQNRGLRDGAAGAPGQRTRARLPGRRPCRLHRGLLRRELGRAGHTRPQRLHLRPDRPRTPGRRGPGHGATRVDQLGRAAARLACPAVRWRHPGPLGRFRLPATRPTGQRLPPLGPHRRGARDRP